MNYDKWYSYFSFLIVDNKLFIQKVMKRQLHYYLCSAFVLIIKTSIIIVLLKVSNIINYYKLVQLHYC